MTENQSAEATAGKANRSLAPIFVLVFSALFVAGAFLYKHFEKTWGTEDDVSWTPKVPSLAVLSALSMESFDVRARDDVPDGFTLTDPMHDTPDVMIHPADSSRPYVGTPQDQIFQSDEKDVNGMPIEKITVRVVEWKDDSDAAEFLTETYFNSGRGNRGNIYQVGRFTFSLQPNSAETSLRPEMLRVLRDAAAPELYIVERIKLTPMMINASARVDFDLSENHEAVHWTDERYLGQEAIDPMFIEKNPKPQFVLGQSGQITVSASKKPVYGFNIFYFDFGTPEKALEWFSGRTDGPMTRYLTVENIGVEISVYGSDAKELDFLEKLIREEIDRHESRE